jgi:hypothetical protein
MVGGGTDEANGVLRGYAGVLSKVETTHAYDGDTLASGAEFAIEHGRIFRI